MIGSGTLTKQLASYFAGVNYDALDSAALRVTKEHILYTLGTVLAGSSAPGAKEVLAGARAFGAGQESTVLPEFYHARIRRELGPMYQLLPEGCIEHDPYAYMASEPTSLTQLGAPSQTAVM